MLGESISDPDGIESAPHTQFPGLGLLPLHTQFNALKKTLRVVVRAQHSHAPFGSFEHALGYWIHAGTVSLVAHHSEQAICAVEVCPESEAKQPSARWEPDGAVVLDDAHNPVVFGTMVHGLLENESPRRHLLCFLAARQGRTRAPSAPVPSIDQELDRIADAVEAAVDMDAICRLVGYEKSPGLR